MFLFCVCDQLVSVKLSSRALAEECRHSREWRNKSPVASRTACSYWRAFLDLNSTSSTQLHQYTTSHWCKSTSRHRMISLLRSVLISRIFVRCNALSSNSARFPWNTEHQKLKKSLLVWESRRSLSVLLGRERRFARCMLGSGVLNPRWWSFTSAGSFPPSAHPVVSKQHRSSTDYWIIKIR